MPMQPSGARRLVVLRDLSQRQRPASHEDRWKYTRASTSREIRVESFEATPTERDALLADPQILDNAWSLPMRAFPSQGSPSHSTSDSWGVSAVGADATRFTGDGVVIALLDDGVRKTHPAFEGVEMVERDFVKRPTAQPQHGTHCAGTILGRDVEGVRIGIAPGVRKLLVGRIFDEDGRSDSASIAHAMHWAMEAGAQIVNMSLGIDFPGLVSDLQAEGWPTDIAVARALEAYRENIRLFDRLVELIGSSPYNPSGVLVVGATGNESRRDESPEFDISVAVPAAAKGIISVGAIEQKGAGGWRVASFSNSLPTVVAPGVDVLSAAADGGLRLDSGTSMACPHVAGIAALWWEALRSWGMPATATSVAARVMTSGRLVNLDTSSSSRLRGNGIVTAPE